MNGYKALASPLLKLTDWMLPKYGIFPVRQSKASGQVRALSLFMPDVFTLKAISLAFNP